MEWKKRGWERQKTAGEWVSGRKGNWEWEWKDIEGFTSACQRVQYCCQDLSAGTWREEEAGRKICTCPASQTWLLTHYRLHRAWGTQLAVVRELLESSSVQLHPPPLPWSSSTWYSPFKRLHVISVCAGSSLRAAAHSTFSSAGALTFPYACWAASLFPPLSFFSLWSFCALSFSLSPVLYPFLLFPALTHTHTHTFSDCLVLGHTDVILCAVTGTHHLCAVQQRTEEGLAFFLCAN